MGETAYIPSDTDNLITRCRGAILLARARMDRATPATKDMIIAPLHDEDEVTVGEQIELLCSRLNEQSAALERVRKSAE